ncbi:psmG3, partial [Symbiodinium pilosum]
MAFRPAGPPESHQWEAEIQGTPTSFVITDFGSELFFLITQNAKIGSLIQATASAPNSGDAADLGGLARGERTYDVQVLFGDRRQEHYRAIARSLIEVVAQKSSKPILLGIQLKEHNVDIF